MNLDPQEPTGVSPGGTWPSERPATTATASPDTGPAAVRTLVSVDEYLRMADAGVWEPGRRIELIEGEIVDMSPMETPHWRSLQALLEWTRYNLPRHLGFTCQMSLVLRGQRSVPEPDLAWFVPFPEEYRRAEGPDVVLIVEVADTSRRQDLTVKRRLYAAASVPEYWVVDLDRRRVVVHRTPEADDYRAVTEHGDAETVAPLCAPEATLSVGALLPPRDESPANPATST